VKPRLGSDHAPLIVDSRAIKGPVNKQFRFEKWWLKVEGFEQVVYKFGVLLAICQKLLIDGNLKLET
jgi:hypothetical protein